jgi:hypothetical protein
MLPRVLLFSVIIKSENTKISFTFCNYIKKPQNIFIYSFSLLSVIYFLLFCFIRCTYSETLCLTTSQWNWIRKTQGDCFASCVMRRKSFFDRSPIVWYKPQVTIMGKFYLATTLCT